MMELTFKWGQQFENNEEDQLVRVINVEKMGW